MITIFVVERTDEAEDKAGVWRNGRAIWIGVRGLMQWEVVCCDWQLEASGYMGRSVKRLRISAPAACN